MNSQELCSLQEAYLEVVMNEAKKSFPFEKVDNQIKSKEKQEFQLGKNVKDGLISHKRATPLKSKLVDQQVRMSMVFSKEKEKKKEGDNLKKSPTFYRKDKHLSKMTKTQREEYDLVFSHLLDEGYADTEQAAEAIMVNMSEDWRESIMEGMKPLPVDRMSKQAEHKAFQNNFDVGGSYHYYNTNKKLKKMSEIGGEKVEKAISRGRINATKFRNRLKDSVKL